MKPSKKDTWKYKLTAYMISQGISLPGSSIISLAIIWYVTLRTGSGSMVAGVTVTTFLPQALIMLYGGALAVSLFMAYKELPIPHFKLIGLIYFKLRQANAPRLKTEASLLFQQHPEPFSDRLFSHVPQPFACRRLPSQCLKAYGSLS